MRNAPVLSNIKIARVGLILVAVPLAFELVFVLTLTCLIAKAESEIRREAHARAVIFQASTLLKHACDASTLAGGDILSFNEAMSRNYLRHRNEVDKDLQALTRTLQNNPAQQSHLEEIKADVSLAMEEIGSITRKAQEGSLISAFSSMPVWLITNRTRLNEVHGAIEQLLAGERAIEQQGPSARQRSRQQIQVALAGGLALNVLLAIALAVYFSQQISARLHVLIDNTSRKAHGQPLREPLTGADELAQFDSVFHAMVKGLEEADRARQQLVATVSHELKTPLNSLDATLSLAEAGALGDLDDLARQKLQVAQSNVRHLISLIGDLLDVERMEAGKLPMSFAPVKLHDIFEQAREKVQAEAQSNRITLVIPSEDHVLCADLPRLSRALAQLLANAVKYSPAGSTVTVSVQKTNDELVICVEDQGCGISPENLVGIFDRLSQDATTGGARVGLGLPLAQAVVRQHSGTISVESRALHGSRFCIHMPRHSLSSGEQEHAAGNTSS
jgi:signal transduction histidine kinase